jgi:hypothetical protein
MIGDAVNGDERRRRDRAAHDVEGMREGRHRRATDGDGEPRRIGEWAGLPIFEDPRIPPAKVGSEREGWRARLAHVELLLREAREAAADSEAVPYTPGAQITGPLDRALAEVRAMLNLEPSANVCTQCGDTTACPRDRIAPGGTCGHPVYAGTEVAP